MRLLTCMIRKLGIALSIFAIIYFLPVTLHGQWTHDDAENHSGPAYSFALDGSNLFVGTAVGVYRSSDNGVSWSSFNSGLPIYPSLLQINGLLIDGSNILAASLHGLYKSSKNSANWSLSMAGIPEHTSIAMVVRLGDNLFAATQGKGVFISTDHASSWTAVNIGLPAISFLFISALGVSGTNLFAATQSDGVFLSSNNGTNWVSASAGLPSTNGSVHSFAQLGSTLFAGTELGLFATTDNGTLWTSSGTGMPANATINSLVVNGTKIFAGTFSYGVYLSVNGGLSWSPAGLTNTFGLIVSGSNLFAASNEGVYVTSNDGSQWTLVNEGLKTLTVKSLLTRSDSIFVGTESDGVYLKDNAGLTKISTGYSLSSSVITNGPDYFFSTGTTIERLTYTGASWAEVSSTLFNAYSLCADANILLAGTNIGVYASSSNGISWSLSNAGMPSSEYVACFAKNPSGIFAGTHSAGVYRSNDHGATWIPATTGIPSNIQQNITTLLVVGNRIFAGTFYNGIYVSTNDGASWSAVNTGLESNNNPVQALASVGNLLFAGTSLGVYLSYNNGASWVLANSGLDNTYITSLATTSTHVIAGTTAWSWSRPLSDFTPEITSFAPSFGPVGTPVTIIGKNFDPEPANSTVTFNGIQATVASATPTQLTVNVPNGALTGPIVVVTHGYTLTSTSNFCVSPPKPTISSNLADPSNPILTSSSATNNQWFKDGIAIAGATNATFNVTVPGIYAVQVLDTCPSPISDAVSYLILGEIDPGVLGIRLYPVPASEWIMIDLEGLVQNQTVRLEIYNQLGQRIDELTSSGGSRVQLPIALIPNGIYLILARQSGSVFAERFIKR